MERANNIGSCVVYEPLDRYVGRHLDRQIGRLSVDTSTDARPICRSTSRPTLGRCVDRDVSVDVSTDISADVSTDMSGAMLTDTSRSIYRPCVGRHVDRWATDIPPTPHCYWRTGDCSLSRRHNLTLVSDF